MADWKFYMPAELVEPEGILIKGERKRLIHGIASTESKDKHGEEMVLSGMDFKPYLESGHLNDDHMAGEQHILGKPIEAKLVTDSGKYKPELKGQPGFYQVCELFDTEPGRAAWENMKSSKDDPKRQRGFSVEGAVLEAKAHKLTKTLVEDCALTRKPANIDTFADFMAKSLSFSGSPALGLQNLDDGEEDTDSQAITGIPLEEVLWGTCKHNCYDDKGRFRKGAKSALFHLVKCRGVDDDEAYDFVRRLKKAGYLK